MRFTQYQEIGDNETSALVYRRNNKSIILTDDFYKLKEKDIGMNLKNEAESRWNLYKTAISLNANPTLLQLINGIKTKNVFMCLTRMNKEKMLLLQEML